MIDEKNAGSAKQNATWPMRIEDGRRLFYILMFSEILIFAEVLVAFKIQVDILYLKDQDSLSLSI